MTSKRLQKIGGTGPPLLFVVTATQRPLQNRSTVRRNTDSIQLGGRTTDRPSSALQESSILSESSALCTASACTPPHLASGHVHNRGTASSVYHNRSCETPRRHLCGETCGESFNRSTSVRKPFLQFIHQTTLNGDTSSSRTAHCEVHERTTGHDNAVSDRGRRQKKQTSA